MQKNDRFSVVIPLYNKEKEIRRALESVFNQEYQKLEVIVVDDGSTDNSLGAVTSLSHPKMRVIHQDNRGVSAARNAGIKEAIYELIAFLDADDAWRGCFLSSIVRLRRKFPMAGAYAAAYNIVMPNGKVVKPELKHIPSEPWEGLIPSYFRSALGAPPVWTSAVVVPKIVLERVGLFDEEVRMGEDKEMWERIALSYPIALTRTIGSTYYMNANSRACNAHPAAHRQRPFVRYGMQAIERNDVGGPLGSDLLEYISQLNLIAAADCLFNYDDPQEALSYVKRSHPRTLGIMLKKCLLRLVLLFPPRTIKLFWKMRRNLIDE